MPRSTEVAKRHGGLAVHWLQSSGGWATAAKMFNLLTPSEGRRQKIRYRLVDEALTHFELHSGWPNSRQASNSLRFHRWTRHDNWESLLSVNGFHPRVLEHLLERWKRHYAWANQARHTARLTRAQQTISQIICLLCQLEPFGRSSP
jgi:hypothetical protein